MLDAAQLSAAQLSSALPAGITRPKGDLNLEKAMKVGQDFEALFISDAFKRMVADVKADPMSDTSTSDTWRELLVDEYARDMVRRGGIGLAGTIADELLRLQEASNG